MPVIQGQEWTFNTVAETYEKIRPGYPDELYRAVFAYCPVDAGSYAEEYCKNRKLNCEYE